MPTYREVGNDMVQTEVVEVDLGRNGGRRVFRHYDDLLRFLNDEREAWSWLFGYAGQDPGNSAGRVEGRLNHLIQQVTNWQDQGTRLRDAADSLVQSFSPDGQGILVHDGDLGERIHAIAKAATPAAAAFAYSFSRGWVQIPQATSIDQLQALMMLALPWTAGPTQISQRLEQERANLRSTLRRQLVEGEKAEQDRAAGWNDLEQKARTRTLRWIREQALRWNRARRAESASLKAAIESIKDVERSYIEAMRLQAPARYWRNKAKIHKAAEKNAREALWKFFPSALSALALAFAATSYVLLRPNDGHDAAVYVVISAGLATFAGVIFWIGRILTRLYLSEHHLRKDAEEREVMTTTYLALTKDQAADEKDRHIILAALFRNSSDGIVKDDGAADGSLASALARLGMPRP